MLEARHTMDAPTTTSAENGTSGGGGGWFTPRNKPAPGGETGPAEPRRPAAIRPVGRPTPPPQAPADGPNTAPSAPAPTGGTRAGTPGQEHASPDATPEAPVLTREHAPRETAPASSPVAARHASASAVPASPPAAAQHAPSPGTAHQATASSPGPVPTALTPAPFASTVAPPATPRVPGQRPAPAPARGPAAPTAPASPDALLVRRAMAEIAPVADKVTSYFYALLFVRHPDLRPLFPAAMDTQRDRLLRALLTAAEHIDNTHVLVDYLQNLGRGHRKYGTRAEHYPAVGECLIGALSKYAAGVWDEEMEAAWVRTYTTISQIMIDAAAADELRAPAWWYAEVVTHELRTPDIAVVTVRPDQPYPFLAGQYTSVETPWWPRIWRHYSFASAPRSDGLLSFHVKAVPAGWVSNALVHRARPGDIIRLGPPAGSMTVDHTTDSGLLCLGGGTGIAPIKALVEDVAEHGERRPVEVFYGARTDQDLYDIDTMLRLQQAHPWLSVRAIIDQQAHQQLPDAIRAYGPWDEYDAYLSGPPGMIRSGVDALRDIGIPSDRIRHDSVEELVAAGD
ncbi:globin domain-containing protein [Streptomyces sp. NPDC057794]|uniref:globin domain-containing protein n=1 Tax=Streptomyces sp. NPDC057794 TaxID=3346251 RepID=UPI0036878428